MCDPAHCEQSSGGQIMPHWRNRSLCWPQAKPRDRSCLCTCWEQWWFTAESGQKAHSLTSIYTTWHVFLQTLCAPWPHKMFLKQWFTQTFKFCNYLLTIVLNLQYFLLLLWNTNGFFLKYIFIYMTLFHTIRSKWPNLSNFIQNVSHQLKIVSSNVHFVYVNNCE